MNTLHYVGMHVELRPSAGRTYIVWDLVTNQKFANENFSSVQEAISFCNQNEMVIKRVVNSKHGYSDVLVSTTGTTIDLTNISLLLSKEWYKWKNNSMTSPKDKSQMRRDIIELLELNLD